MRRRNVPHETIKEITNDEQRNVKSNYAHGAGGRDDARFRRSPPPGLRRLDQARAVQALVRAARLVAGGLRDRSEGGRRLALRVAWPRWPGDGDARAARLGGKQATGASARCISTLRCR